MPRLSEVAQAIGAEFIGNGDFIVEGINHPAAAGPNDLALAMEKNSVAALAESRAQTAVMLRGQTAKPGTVATIYVDHPRYALAGLTRLFARPLHAVAGIHPTALVDSTATVAKPTSIGPFVQIGPGAQLGPRAIILGQVTIGAGARIGADALIHPGVRIGERVEIGDRVILHHNASLGADGFSFAIPDLGTFPSPGPSPGRPPGQPAVMRISSLGTVILGDDVEIGANTCVDRGTIEATTIGSGTKIDNLVMIAHNTQIGRGCLIAGQVGIAGSCQIGNGVIMAAGVGISDHLSVGDGAVLMAGAKVAGTRIGAGAVVIGTPAVSREKFWEQMRHLHRLKNLYADVASLKARLGVERGTGQGASSDKK